MANPAEDSPGGALSEANKQPRYVRRKKIHPKLAFGRYRIIKWSALIALLAFYYLIPWLRWDRGLNTPDQAILVDIPARKFYFFFIELWPQEIYYWTGLLILAAVGLFFVTSIAGRVWCGYACPQTVWTDLFIYVERLFEGDRNARIRLDKARWGIGKILRKLGKHLVWILIGIVTGGAWVFYFVDAPTLARELLAFEAPSSAYLTIAFLTATTYVMAGWAREQVCTYMCPYARFQSAMFDEDTLLVTYRDELGEPRGSHKKDASWDARGRCVDCNQCVAVCPTGIDIRDGQQLECINCALCVDACNSIMDRVGQPRGLIRYDTQRNLEARETGADTRARIIRPRTVTYAAILVVLMAIMVVSLWTRSTLEVNVLRDRNPLFTLLSDGSVRNGYTYKVLNKSHDSLSLTLRAEGIPGATLRVLGTEAEETEVMISARPDQVESFRIFVHAPLRALEGGSNDLRFLLMNSAGESIDIAGTAFVGPDK
ncbi:MAG: cytochrome c oxidase accessory protein CcoG [Rhodospirillaceae bacterium]|jgi:cytochrome c oxidase accessory protein FixG|nr:cytochrome c oxidase accessory protein CcoG [Rhodospirillaceae bacterium]MBT4426140.1 cytochrome c oxidase accessory protein CcoG [Rhodospirillaceae bacterium]MBT5039468.1 cytochrome c oxidase accessory protein CcoG [Rhodospirillaceae bacterium]MBT5676485.1 cytochrome c oxidase accessory protein CcoG [Rhodospirillaceae bacterium]MBT7294655.1 cytochrome c oxidase accessory protein CcoG [Rhodospirillaceae bacterium]